MNLFNINNNMCKDVKHAACNAVFLKKWRKIWSDGISDVLTVQLEQD